MHSLCCTTLSISCREIFFADYKYFSYLAAVDLEEAAGHLEVVVLVFGRLEILEHVPGCQRVDAVLGVLRLAVELPAHGVRLAGPGLAVREAGGHPALEDALHQRLGRVLVHQLVVRALVKCVVESEKGRIKNSYSNLFK